MSTDSSRDSFWHVIEHLPIGIFLSRAGRVVYANPTFARYLGYPNGDSLVGFGPEEILAPEDRERGIAHVVPAGAPFRSVPRREWRVRRRDGTMLTVETEATQQIEFAGERAVLWTVLDMTELRSVQAKLLQADRLAAIGLLAASVGHEINNPLTYVLSALELLQTQLPALTASTQAVAPSQVEPLLRAVEEAVHGVDRVRSIVRDLKTFSRVEQDVVRVDPHAVLESTLQIAMTEIRPRARLVRSFAPCPAVLATEAAIGQVFLNLIVNAAQAIPEGDPAVHQIYVSTATSNEGEAVIEISDTGCGIPHEMQERVFDPFVTTKPIGTGLGLAICRNTVRGMGGTISLESEPNLGTTVRVVFPPAPARTTGPLPAAPRAGTSTRDVTSSRCRLLVVDDEPAIVATIARILSPSHDVVGVTDARDACQRIAAGERFDLVITDLIMPGMTGMEMHDAIAAIDAAQASRILLLTGGAFTTAAASFLDRVALPRMAKPFNSLELIDQVSELLRDNRQAT